MYIILGIVLAVFCGWIPIVCGTESFALPFIGGLCGIIIALGFFLSGKLSEIKKNQEEILHHIGREEKDKNEGEKNN